MRNTVCSVTEANYAERVYAGVLGKIIGVYLGRPFEQWSHEKIERELGEIHGYVNDRLGQPLVVTDDDISGTFTFLRALSENGNDPCLTPAQIGDWWLNTVIEGRTILWWGGRGLSTEHTAFLRLREGHRAPESGSIALNGAAVAEEIGAQIFIDGWGMVCPGDPERAADFARRAAGVSHGGEAIYGAQVVASLVSLAFVEYDIGAMLAMAQSLIPPGSLISTLIGDMTQWAAENGDDWQATLRHIHQVYPYERFGTVCPMVSNHAIVLLALLHGGGDFARSLMIANTSGYDTDCNSGNVGCILGVRNGLAGLGNDWRGPVADRLYLPTADGGRAITDALREAYAVVGSACALAGQPFAPPKLGARFHFSLPGSVQGFRVEASPEGPGLVTLDNADGRLALHLSSLAAGRAARIATATFIPPDMLSGGGYQMVASPTLYPGQTVTARVQAGDLTGPVTVGLTVRVYGDANTLPIVRGASQTLANGQSRELSFTVPDTHGQPVAEVGLEVLSQAATYGTLHLDWLTWDGPPRVTLGLPAEGNDVWLRAWVNGADHFETRASPGYVYRVVQDRGTGLVSQGEASWRGYTARVTALPHLAERVGLCAAVGGLRRFVALLLDSDKHVRLVRQWDGERRVLADLDWAWVQEQPLSLSLTVAGGTITARADNTTVTVAGDGLPLSGGVGLLVEEGHAEFGAVQITPEDTLEKGIS